MILTGPLEITVRNNIATKYKVNSTNPKNYFLFPAAMICSQEPRDVFLVVDGSLSIGNNHFEKIRQFLKTLVKTLVVSPNVTHFGLLQFSSRQKTRIEFSLDYSHREATLLNRIKYLRYQRGTSTFTGNALKIVEEQVSEKPRRNSYAIFWIEKRVSHCQKLPSLYI